jgi:hypothetical protein
MIVFDASATHGEHTVTGNTNLDLGAWQAYVANMPNTSLFLNGYGPSFSAATGSGPTPALLLSFDYYVDPSK